jgi:hypothetical protein
METKSPRFSRVRRELVGRHGDPGLRLPRFARHLGYVVALLVLPGVALAAAVTVKGKTTGSNKLLNPVWNESKDPNLHRFTFREPSPTVRPDVRTLTGNLRKELCIAALVADKAPTPKVPLRMKIIGGRTDPVTLVVAEGQQIQFENLDPFPHKLYDTGSKGLSAVETAASKSRSWTPPGPGKYEIRDQSSPSVRSWIVVEPRVVSVGYPDRKGDFAIDLEPGKYKLRGYFNGEPVGTELDISVNPLPAEQQLKLPLVVGEGAPDAGAGG